MAHISILRTAALTLRTSTFRSLPWGRKVAHALTVLASSTATAFGRALQDALEKRGIKLDGRRFGEKVYRAMLGKYRDTELVEDAMIDVATKFSVKPELLRADLGQSAVESYVMQAVQFAVMTALKAKRNLKEDSLFDTDDSGEDLALELDDPRAVAQFEDLLDASDVRILKNKLRSVLPWAPGYLDMLLDGYTDKEIIGDVDKGFPSELAKKLHQEWLTNPKGQPMTMGMWSKPGGWKDKVRDIIRQHMTQE